MENEKYVTDYSGYNEKEMVARTREEYNKISERYFAASIVEEQNEIVYEHGIRYTELSRLPYFDPVRCHLVAPDALPLVGNCETYIANMD